ncbi:hypothetical protein [Rodentibacter haemolyticus]|uniref:Uncharacterized protein n=1 Tax=Rodentibacter haemolyticus TaxID=2778911 RepID=A0ABX6UWU4_9PAST|nr:hypothetical protein [Rodentibacter haemolyticus]QPB42244.1 hypothetical protein IHV77_10080 [Rodentibacter haemolyticus]
MAKTNKNQSVNAMFAYNVAKDIVNLENEIKKLKGLPASNSGKPEMSATPTAKGYILNVKLKAGITDSHANFNLNIPSEFIGLTAKVDVYSTSKIYRNGATEEIDRKLGDAFFERLPVKLSEQNLMFNSMKVSRYGQENNEGYFEENRVFIIYPLNVIGDTIEVEPSTA